MQNKIFCYLLLLKSQTYSIDAIAGLFRLPHHFGIVENVAQVTSTAGANHLCTYHTMAGIAYFSYRTFVYGFVKAGPAALGIELGVAMEKLVATGLAHISAAVPKCLEFAAIRPFGAFLAQNPVFFWGELGAPLGVCFVYDMIFACIHGVMGCC